jgi:hypothetical protein
MADAQFLDPSAIRTAFVSGECAKGKIMLGSSALRQGRRHLVSLLTSARVNQRMRNKIRGRRGSDLRVDLVAAIGVNLTARHTLHLDGVGRLQDVSDRRAMRPKEIQEDVTLAPRGFAVDDPIHIVGHTACFSAAKSQLRE